MNDFRILACLDPIPFVHYVVRESHPDHPGERRDACLCGWRSSWMSAGHSSTHPHRQVTVSRTDLTSTPHPSNGVYA